MTDRETIEREICRLIRAPFSDVEGLSAEEKDVANLLATGHTAPEVASTLGLSLSTVYRRLDMALLKIGAAVGGVMPNREALTRVMLGKLERILK